MTTTKKTKDRDGDDRAPQSTTGSPRHNNSAQAKQKRFYRAGTLTRIRRTSDQTDQLDAQILAVLREDHPQSVRHVFYRMTDPRLPEPVEKSGRGYRHVQARCVVLRRNGRLPYVWIADLSRRGYFVNTVADASDFVTQMSGLYRADLWRDANCLCEGWAESRSIASVLTTDCATLAVDLYPCGGFSSLSFVHEAAESRNHSGDDRRLKVIYVGDFDPVGVLIDVALERELRLHMNSAIDMDFIRIAINEDQVEAYDLPTKPRKDGDKRWRHIAYTVEAEAMPAKTLRAILRDQVEALLPPDALAVVKVAEQAEREHLRKMAAMLGVRL
jgi:hypothetical protein